MFRSIAGDFFKRSRLTLDNLVFRLHYRVTVGLLLACAVALLWKITYGRPITCVSDDLDNSILIDHCWYDGVFTISNFRKTSVHTAYPGVGIIETRLPFQKEEYHNVHRWVVIGVLVQAAFFYLPRIIWRTLEGQMVRRLSWNMNEPKKTSSVKMLRKELIVGYLKNTSHRNIIYAGGHFMCEVLNLVNVIVQFFLVGHILKLYFPFVNFFLQFAFQREDDSTQGSFPLKTKCRYFKFGQNGDAQKHDAFCFMSVNVLMESIFICQWIWFVLLINLSVLAVFYRFLLLVLPPLRAYKLAGKANLSDINIVKKAVQQLGFGEWFVLYMMSKNVDPVDTRDILEGLIDNLAAKEQQFVMVNTGQAI